MGVRFPLPAPSNLFICNTLREGKCRRGGLRYKYGTESIVFIFNSLLFSKVLLEDRHLYTDISIIDSKRLAIVYVTTECTADNSVRQRDTSTTSQTYKISAQLPSL